MKSKDNDYVYIFPARLNQNIDEVKGQIMGLKPLPSICQVLE